MYYGYGAILTAKAGPVNALELIIVQPRRATGMDRSGAGG